MVVCESEKVMAYSSLSDVESKRKIFVPMQLAMAVVLRLQPRPDWQEDLSGNRLIYCSLSSLIVNGSGM